jgi:hypothetical protein
VLNAEYAHSEIGLCLANSPEGCDGEIVLDTEIVIVFFTTFVSDICFSDIYPARYPQKSM